MKILNIVLLAAALVVVGIILCDLIPGLTDLNAWYYVLIGAVLLVVPGYSIVRK